MAGEDFKQLLCVAARCVPAQPSSAQLNVEGFVHTGRACLQLCVCILGAAVGHALGAGNIQLNVVGVDRGALLTAQGKSSSAAKAESQ